MSQVGINSEIKFFNSGVHNMLSDTLIPSDAATDENNWFMQDGRIRLVGGRIPIGTQGATGQITGEIFGYKIDGSTIHWRKSGTEIQYWNGTIWVATVTGLTADEDYAFSNYSSLAGAFTFFFGLDGIYKVNNANPGSFISLYNSAKNFKGRAFINKGRTILWNRKQDKTGLYGSYIDAQNSTVYTTVSGEATVSLGGTLAFKAGGATRNCFGVTITLTGSGEVYTDNFLGVLMGSLGGTGTINYITGVYTLSNSGVGTAGYQWEDSNIKGVTDFTKSATRVAGEGFQFPQDMGGDAILNVLIGQDGAYYSMKKSSVYRLVIGTDDTATNTDNSIYRLQLGIPSWKSATSLQFGILFMNTATPEKPELTILKKNSIGGNVEPYVLFPQFKFANYVFDDCVIDNYERYVVIACKSLSSAFNNTILLGDVGAKKIDIINYPARTFATDAGNLYCGSPISFTVYKILNGFDDVGLAINNYWIGKGELYQLGGIGQARSRRFFPASLKKHRKLRFKGLIDPNQSYSVSVDYDDAGPQIVGTILGSGSYVDYSSPQTVGSNMVGESQVGGNDSVTVFPYFAELRIKKPPKFMKRKIKFIALGIGYVDIEYQNDWGLSFFEDKIPARFRQKQNISVDGTQTNLSNPQF